jgi:transposase
MTSSDPIPLPRLKIINRQQMLLRTVDVEQLIEPDHAARCIWEFVGRLNLDCFFRSIRSIEGYAGRSALDPQLLISLWIYAYSRGVGSAREISRQCEIDPAFQWLTGMESINHHTLSDFRVDHSEALDELFTQVLGLLSHEGLITLERVMQDGTKVRAQAQANTFCKEDRIRQHLDAALQHIRTMGDPKQEPPSDHRGQAKLRAARERVEKLERALKEVEALRAAKMEDKRGYEPRVSTTDPDARIMKTSDGGFAPSFNMQVVTDAHMGLVTDVRVTQDVNDKHQLLPGMEGLASRLEQKPKQVVADGDFTTNLSVIQMAEHGIDFFGSWNPGPVGQKHIKPDWRGIHPEFQRDAFRYDSAQDHYVCPAGKLLVLGKTNKLPHGGEDRFYKATRADCGPCENRDRCCPHYASRGRIITRRVEPAEVTAFKMKMETPAAKAVYKQRSQIAEFPFAWIKEKLGLRRFHVRGLIKAGTEALWVCLTFNIQAWIRFQSKASAAHAG